MEDDTKEKKVKIVKADTSKELEELRKRDRKLSRLEKKIEGAVLVKEDVYKEVLELLVDSHRRSNHVQFRQKLQKLISEFRK